MNSLITITDAAVAHLKQMMTKQANGKGFRLSIKKTGCSGYAYVPTIIEKVIDTDLHFVVNGELPVYIDKESEVFLKGVEIDYVLEAGTGLKQKRLVFINPNEKNRCGCGESFTIE